MKIGDKGKIVIFFIVVATLPFLFSNGDEKSGALPTVQVNQKGVVTGSLKLPFNTKETYYIQTKEIPTFTEAVFNPLYSNVGREQKVAVKVKAPESVNSVSIDIQGDKKTVSHGLKLSTGSATDGVWEGNWKINDTHDKIYTAILKAKSNNNSSHIDLNFK